MRRSLTALFGAVVLLLSLAAPAQAAVGQVRNSNSHRCLAVAGGSAAPGALAVQFTCDGEGYRLWGVDGPLDDRFQLRNVYSGLCLGVNNWQLNGVVTQGPCFGRPETTWRAVDGPEFGVQLQSHYSGLCLSPAGGSQDVNVVIVQYHCDGNVARGWYA